MVKMVKIKPKLLMRAKYKKFDLKNTKITKTGGD